MAVLLAIITKALGLILLAMAIFIAMVAMLDVNLAGVAPQGCVGRPLPVCFLTII